jgi:hypothetical protein
MTMATSTAEFRPKLWTAGYCLDAYGKTGDGLVGVLRAIASGTLPTSVLGR